MAAENSALSNVNIRHLTPDEHNFVYQTWLRTYFSEDTRGKNLSQAEKDAWFNSKRDSITALLEGKDGTRTFGAFVGTEMLGYMCFRADSGGVVVHYCYIKQPFRRLGIARLLLTRAFRDVPGKKLGWTHETNAWRETCALGTLNSSKFFRPNRASRVRQKRV